jgi:hypothetical protein
VPHERAGGKANVVTQAHISGVGDDGVAIDVAVFATG